MREGAERYQLTENVDSARHVPRLYSTAKGRDCAARGELGLTNLSRVWTGKDAIDWMLRVNPFP
jgi:hypothetical protein